MATNVYPKLKPVEAKCSCINCENIYCFSKRPDLATCSCENCNEPKTCYFYKNKSAGLKKTNSDATSSTGDNTKLKVKTNQSPELNLNQSPGPNWNQNAGPNFHQTPKPNWNQFPQAKSTPGPGRYWNQNPKPNLNQYPVIIWNQQPLPNSYQSSEPDGPETNCCNNLEPKSNQIHNAVSPPKCTTNTTQTKSALELCKSLLVAPRSTLEELKNKFLCRTTETSCQGCQSNRTHGTTDKKMQMNSETKIESCVCTDISKPPGYVYDLKEERSQTKHKSAPCAHVLDKNWNTIEIPNNKYVLHRSSCDCTDCRKTTIDSPQYLVNPPGYIFELPTTSTEPTKSSPHLSTNSKFDPSDCSGPNKKSSNFNTTAANAHTDEKQKSDLSACENTHCNLKQPDSKQVFQNKCMPIKQPATTQKKNVPNLDKQSDSTACCGNQSKAIKKISNHNTTPENISTPDKPKCDPSACTEESQCKSKPPGYVVDMKHDHSRPIQKSSNYNNTSTSVSTPDKPKYDPSACNGESQCKSKPPGYVVDMKHDNSGPIQKSLHHNTNPTNVSSPDKPKCDPSAARTGESQCKSKPPGYVVDMKHDHSRPIQKSSNYNKTSISVSTPDKPKCDPSACTGESQYKSKPPGYVVDMKHEHCRPIHKSLPHNTNPANVSSPDKPKCDPSACTGESQCKLKPKGYVVDMKHDNSRPIQKSSDYNPTNVYYTLDTQNSGTHACCENSQSKLNLKRLVLDLKRIKPKTITRSPIDVTSTNVHILDKNWNTIEIPENKYLTQTNDCVCIDCKRDILDIPNYLANPPGYVLVLQSNTNAAKQSGGYSNNPVEQQMKPPDPNQSKNTSRAGSCCNQAAVTTKQSQQYIDQQSGKQKKPNDTQQHTYPPNITSCCSGADKTTNESSKYKKTWNTEECNTHILDKNWNTIETVENKYLIKLSSSNCPGCLKDKTYAPKYLINPPGYILEVPKTFDPPTHSEKYSNIPMDHQMKPPDSNQSKNPSHAGSCCDSKNTYQYETTDNSSRNKKTPDTGVFYTHILDKNWNTIETPENNHLLKKSSCDCSDCLRDKSYAPQYLVDPPGYTLQLQSSVNTKPSQQYIYQQTGKQKKPNDTQQHTYPPNITSCCSGADKTTNESSKYKKTWNTEECNTHILDKNWNTIETVENKYLIKLSSSNCPGCLKDKTYAPKYLINPPGYILEVPKTFDPPTHSEKYSNTPMDHQMKPPDSNQSKNPLLAGSCCDSKNTYQHEITEKSNELKETPNTDVFYTHILDKNWNTVETPENNYVLDKSSCDCSDCLREKSYSPQYLVEPPGFTLQPQTSSNAKQSKQYINQQLGKHTTPNNTQQHTYPPNVISYCSEATKTKNGSSKYKKSSNAEECNTHILDKNWDTIETPKNKYLKQKNSFICIDCKRDLLETPKYLADPPGYILELPRYVNTSTTKSQDRCNKLEKQKKPYESLKINDLSETSSCDRHSETHRNKKYHQEYKKHADYKKNKLELCKHILEMQKHTIETLESISSTQKKSCDCEGPSNKTSDSPEGMSNNSSCSSKPAHTRETYHHKFDKQKHEINMVDLPSYKHESENYNENQGKSDHCKDCDHQSGNVNDLPQYIPSHNAQELFRNILGTLPNARDKKSYEFKDSTRTKLKSPGYVVDLSQNKHKTAKKNILEVTRNSSECEEDNPYDARKQQQHTVNNAQVFSVNIIEGQNGTIKKKSCECKRPGHKNAESHGYVVDIEKYLQQNPKRPEQNVLPQSSRAKCVCKRKTSEKNKSPPHKDENLPGYVLDLQTLPQQYDNTQKLNKTLLEKNKDLEQQPCDEPTMNTSSPLEDHALEPQKKNFEPSKTSELFKSIIDTQKYTIETLTNEYQKKSCECKAKKNKSETGGYVVELPKYKPSHNAQELFQNILETQKYSVDTLTNQCDKKTCECNESTKNNLPGYVVDLPKYEQNKTKKVCECDEARKTRSDAEGHVFDHQSPPKFNQPNNTKELFKNILDTQKYVVDTVTNQCDKKTCGCNATTKNKIKGYVVELVTDTQKHNNETNKIKTCNCNESLKIEQETPEYALETVHNALAHEICECPMPKGKRESTGYVYDLPQLSQQYDNTQKPNKTYLETSKELEQQPCLCTSKSCACNESTRKTCPPEDDAYEPQKKVYEPSRNTQELCMSIVEKQGDTTETLNMMQTCNCSSTNKITKNHLCDKHRKLYNNYKKHNTQQQIMRTTDDKCNCNETPHENNVRESQGILDKIYNSIFGTQTNQNNISQKNTYDMCKEQQKVALEALKKIYLPPTDKMKNTQKNTFELCKEQQIKAIEALKNIYLPPKDKMNISQMKNSQKNTFEFCREQQMKATEALKKIYLPSTNKRNVAQDDTFETCKEQHKLAIEALKNIYMPQKCTLDFAKKYEHTGGPHINIDKTLIDFNDSPDYCDEVCTSTMKFHSGNESYKDCRDCNQFDVSNKPDKLSGYDIFKKIKEAYEACSCKVCECVVGKVKSELCKCKPCECTECLSYLQKMEKLSNDALDVVSKCACDQHNKEYYQIDTFQIKKSKICECKPCECIRCTFGMSNLCDCEPCECLECKPKSIRQVQTLVVAPVGEPQRVACTCSPCDCIECGQFYSLTSNVMHEMSTGTNRHTLCRCEICLNESCDQSGADSCKCERRNKVMSKPVEKDTHDFDIRTATIIDNKLLRHHEFYKSTRYDTIAMFAALPNNYPDFISNKNMRSDTKTCSCETCQCITCVCKENTINTIKSSHFFLPRKINTISHLNLRESTSITANSCTCKSCECQICEKRSSNQTSSANKCCVCDTCDCLTCDGNKKLLCKCSSCECTDCVAQMPQTSQRLGRHCRCRICRCKHCYEKGMLTMNPIKKGEVLTPATHKSKVQSIIFDKRHFGQSSSSILKAASNKDPNIEMRDMSFYNELFIPNLQLETSSKPPSGLNESKRTCSISQADNISDVNDFDTKYSDKCETSNSPRQERNKDISLHKNFSIDNDISGSYFSGYSSFETSPKTSCHKDYDSISPISRKNISWESSCNSSGYDYPEYLIQFPKSTVETCLKDVIELDVENAIKLDNINGISNTTIIHDKDQKSHGNSSSEGNHFVRRCNTIEASNSKLIINKQTESRKQHTKSNSYNWIYKDHISSLHDFTSNAYVTKSRRNYKIELSSSLHVHLNKHNGKDNDYNKIIAVKSQEQHQQRRFEWVNKSLSSLLVNNRTRKYVNIMTNYNELHVASKMIDYNITEHDTTNTLCNERHFSWKCSDETPYSYFVSDADIYGFDEDYKSVQRTLKEAKEFSQELQKVLEMYEKANKNFESISEKLKISHASLFCSDFDGRKEICRIEEKFLEKCQIEKEIQEIHLKVPSVREELTPTSILQETEKSGRTGVTSHHENKRILQNLNFENIINYQKENESIAEYNPPNQLKSVLERISTHLENDDICYRSVANEGIIEKHADIIKNDDKTKGVKSPNEGSFYENEDSVTVPNNPEIKKRERLNNKNYKKYSKLLKRTIIISKRISVKNSNQNESKPTVKYCVSVGTSTTSIPETNAKENALLPNYITSIKSPEVLVMENPKREINQIMKKFNNVFGSIEDVPVSISTDTNGLATTAEQNGQQNFGNKNDLEEQKPWTILKKSCKWNTACTKSREVSILPSLELEIKQAVQSISLQTTQPNKTSTLSHHGNKALENLQNEVKKLLDLPILQSQDYQFECSKDILNRQHKNKLDSELNAPQQSSFQTYRKYADNGAYCNLKSDDLEAQVRNLIYMSVLLPYIAKQTAIDDDVKTTIRTPGIGSAHSSCEALKVGFLGVRRMSDHTVLVKWHAPREFNKVKGYELLIDGRAVQKIFSPSKCMAVVTCLPHLDEVLLTIKTITSNVKETGHYPATTVIYRPRVKSQ